MVTRRKFLTAGAAITAATTFNAGAQQPSLGAKPNILFIMADDLGWGDLSCYGRPDYKTPVLDDLAARGVRFTQAYANSSTCSPTRVALITGRYQNRLPVGLYDPLPAGTKVGLPNEDQLKPEDLTFNLKESEGKVSRRLQRGLLAERKQKKKAENFMMNGKDIREIATEILK